MRRVCGTADARRVRTRTRPPYSPDPSPSLSLHSAVLVFSGLPLEVFVQPQVCAMVWGRVLVVFPFSRPVYVAVAVQCVAVRVALVVIARAWSCVRASIQVRVWSVRP